MSYDYGMTTKRNKKQLTVTISPQVLEKLEAFALASNLLHAGKPNLSAAFEAMVLNAKPPATDKQALQLAAKLIKKVYDNLE